MHQIYLKTIFVFMWAYYTSVSVMGLVYNLPCPVGTRKELQLPASAILALRSAGPLTAVADEIHRAQARASVLGDQSKEDSEVPWVHCGVILKRTTGTSRRMP